MEKGEGYLSPRLQEELFQDAINKWEETGEKKYWDLMFIRVAECCRALALKMCPGKPLVEERSLDGAILVMDRIKRLHKHPNKLSSYCYWPVKEALQGPKVVKADLELQYFEEYENQTADKSGYENIRGIYRPELNGGLSYDEV